MEIVRKGKVTSSGSRDAYQEPKKPLNETAVRGVQAQAEKGAATVGAAARQISERYKQKIHQIKDKKLRNSTFSDFDLS